MPVSASVRARLRSHLHPDDEIHYAFPAEVLMSAKPSVFVVVIRKAITVFSTSFRSRKVPRSILTQFPRMTVLGLVDSASTPHFVVAGITYEIDEECCRRGDHVTAGLSTRSVAEPLRRY
ncbi:hypothetical protein [Rhodococcus qingshengii]|uniref:hypothetical protein n=1 Tax=Rhodococcus qingshengii TaxID=334542 RepID=UPI0021BAAC86|nr:hypothetical protein [Rhodococcus qingshengii]UXF64846.1 hypothetical protein N6G92_15500 [Rhodococcus qingshengii]